MVLASSPDHVFDWSMERSKMTRARLLLGIVALLVLVNILYVILNWSNIIYEKTGRLENIHGKLYVTKGNTRHHVREPLLWPYSDYPVVLFGRHRLTGEKAVWLQDSQGIRAFVVNPPIPNAFELVLPERRN